MSKKLFVTCPYGEFERYKDGPCPEKVQRMVDIAKIMFREDDFRLEYYDSRESLESNFVNLLGSHYYISIDDLYGLNGDYLRFDELVNILFRSKGFDSACRVKPWFVFTEKEWDDLTRRNENVKLYADGREVPFNG